MSAVTELWGHLRANYLLSMLDRIGDEVGAPEDASPEQVLEAAVSLRERLAQSKGHRDIPRDALGARVPFRVIGR